MQETLLKAWRGLDRFEGRSSLRSWLYAIATNVCLRMIERRPARVLPIDYGPPSDPHAPLGPAAGRVGWIEPYPDALLGPDAGARRTRRPAMSSARRSSSPSSPRCSACPPGSVPCSSSATCSGSPAPRSPQQLDATAASVYSLLQRAHASLDDRLPERSQQATLRSLGDDRLSEIVNRYVEAWSRSDVDAIVRDAHRGGDARHAARPPAGGAAATRSSPGSAGGPLDGTRSWRLVPTSANGQLAMGAYRLDRRGGVRALRREGAHAPRRAHRRDHQLPRPVRA